MKFLNFRYGGGCGISLEHLFLQIFYTPHTLYPEAIINGVLHLSVLYIYFNHYTSSIRLNIYYTSYIYQLCTLY